MNRSRFGLRPGEVKERDDRAYDRASVGLEERFEGCVLPRLERQTSQVRAGTWRSYYNDAAEGGMAMSSTEANKRTARRWLDLISAHEVEEICAMTDPAWIMHGGPPGIPPGPEGVRELFRTIGPVDQTWTLEDVIAEGDRVVLRARNSCVQESFLGVPGRGRRQTFTAIFILRIVDGRIVETWRNADDLGRLLQLGARIEPGTDLDMEPAHAS